MYLFDQNPLLLFMHSFFFYFLQEHIFLSEILFYK